ncbi:hypothetical protein [Francisella philomiragia]|nr:hypothetical protein [Francisella philomiragia]
MTQQQLVNLFGKQKKISDVIFRKKSAVSQWGKTGVPADCQRIFYYMTNGKLIPSPDVPYVPIEEIQQLLKDKGVI